MQERIGAGRICTQQEGGARRLLPPVYDIFCKARKPFCRQLTRVSRHFWPLEPFRVSMTMEPCSWELPFFTARVRF